ncbi:hypothetical protein MNBD_PLANCTO03-1890, partial [hydrothermal vent metagenome]
QYLRILPMNGRNGCRLLNNFGRFVPKPTHPPPHARGLPQKTAD